MVWPFSSSEDASAKQDPYSSLDPSLRAFLEKESPLKYQADLPPSPPAKPVAEATAVTSSTGPSSASSHNNKSLFPDGRYDYLWRTYRPKTEIDAVGKSDQEKLSDVLDAYKQRRASISAAAVENCAAVRWQQHECITNGSIKQRLALCRYETRALDRCFRANARFLKALGYLSAWDRAPEEDERIQMHADRLYQRMMEQEKLVEEAKRAGRAPPVFEPVLPPEVSVNAPVGAGAGMKTPPEIERLRKGAREDFEKSVQGKNAVEKYYEERAFAAEIDAAVQASEQLDKRKEEVRQGKQERRAKGEASLGDKISGWLGW